MSSLKVVGESPERIDGLEKVTGAAIYVDDIDFGAKLLHAEIVETPYAHALIKSIDTSAAEKVPGVVRVITGKDFPYRFGLYMQDRFIFPTDRVRFVGEQVAAVVARDAKIAKRAAKLVKVVYQELEPVLDLTKALRDDAVLVHPDLGNYTRCPWFFPQAGTNIAHWRKTRKGDIEQGFKEADVILEDTYTVPRYSHCAIEPHVIVGLYDLSGRLTLWSASQSPYTQRHVLAQALAPLGVVPQGHPRRHPVRRRRLRRQGWRVDGDHRRRVGHHGEGPSGQGPLDAGPGVLQYLPTTGRHRAHQTGREERRHDYGDRAFPALGCRRLRRIRRQCGECRRALRHRTRTGSRMSKSIRSACTPTCRPAAPIAGSATPNSTLDWNPT